MTTRTARKDDVWMSRRAIGGAYHLSDCSTLEPALGTLANRTTALGTNETRAGYIIGHTPPCPLPYATFWNGTTTPPGNGVSDFSFGISNDAMFAASISVCIDSLA